MYIADCMSRNPQGSLDPALDELEEDPTGVEMLDAYTCDYPLAEMMFTELSPGDAGLAPTFEGMEIGGVVEDVRVPKSTRVDYSLHDEDQQRLSARLAHERAMSAHAQEQSRGAAKSEGGLESKTGGGKFGAKHAATGTKQGQGRSSMGSSREHTDSDEHNSDDTPFSDEDTGSHESTTSGSSSGSEEESSGEDSDSDSGSEQPTEDSEDAAPASSREGAGQSTKSKDASMESDGKVDVAYVGGDDSPMRLPESLTPEWVTVDAIRKEQLKDGFSKGLLAKLAATQEGYVTEIEGQAPRSDAMPRRAKYAALDGLLLFRITEAGDPKGGYDSEKRSELAGSSHE